MFLIKLGDFNTKKLIYVSLDGQYEVLVSLFYWLGESIDVVHGRSHYNAIAHICEDDHAISYL